MKASFFLKCKLDYACIQFLSLRFDYWCNLLPSSQTPLLRTSEKGVPISIFLHLITISFLSKSVQRARNPNSNQGDWDRYQLLSTMASYHAETLSPDGSDKPKGESKDAADDVAAERESGNELFHPAAFHRTSFHICLQSSERRGRRPSYVGVLRACGLTT